MNQKVLYSVIVIGVVASLAIGGTYAYFTATRTTSENKFTAGTLDLSVVAPDGTLAPFVIDNMGANGKIGGTKTWTITNTGSLPGRLMVSLKNVINEENGCANEQESDAAVIAAGSNCGAVGKEGDLGKVVTLKVSLDGAEKVASTLASDQVLEIGDEWAKLDQIVIPAGEKKTVTTSWEATETSYGNEIQGDEIKFDMNFRLVQDIEGVVPSNL